MHVRVNTARETEQVFTVNDLLGLIGADLGREPRKLAVLDADVEQIDRGLIGAHDTDIFDDEIEGLIHRYTLSFTVWARRERRLTRSPRLAARPGALSVDPGGIAESYSGKTCRNANHHISLKFGTAIGTTSNLFGTASNLFSC